MSQTEKILYYSFTVLNIVLALIAMCVTIMVLIQFNVAKRWVIYILYILTTLIGITLVHCYYLYNQPGVWQHRLVSTLVIVSKLYFAECLKKSSIKKT